MALQGACAESEECSRFEKWAKINKRLFNRKWRWQWRKEVMLRRGGWAWKLCLRRLAALAWRAPRHAAYLQSGAPSVSTPLTVQKQLGRFLPKEEKCSRNPRDNWRWKNGPGYSTTRWAVYKEELLLMRMLSRLGEYRINTSGSGILRCSPAGQGNTSLKAWLADCHLALRPSPLPL